MSGPSSSTTAQLDHAFRALDATRAGYVTLEHVMAFTECIRRHLSSDEVRRIFKLQQGHRAAPASSTRNAVSSSHNDGLDRAAFGRVMRMLCAAANSHAPVDVGDLVAKYESAQLRLLFELVDDDHSGAISRDELRPLLDALTQVLGLGTMCDVGIILRGVGVDPYGSVSPQQFASIVSKLMGNGTTPVSHVVAAFKETKRKKRHVLTATMLQSSPSTRMRSGSLLQSAIDGSSDAGGESLNATRRGRSIPQGGGGSCQQCASHIRKVNELEAKVRVLEGRIELLQKGGVVSDEEEDTASTIWNLGHHKWDRRGGCGNDLQSDATLVALMETQQQADAGVGGILIRSKVESHVVNRWLVALRGMTSLASKSIPQEITLEVLPSCESAIHAGRRRFQGICHHLNQFLHQESLDGSSSADADDEPLAERITSGIQCCVEGVEDLVADVVPSVLEGRRRVSNFLLVTAAAPLATIPAVTTGSYVGPSVVARRRKGVAVASEFEEATVQFTAWCEELRALVKHLESVVTAAKISPSDALQLMCRVAYDEPDPSQNAMSAGMEGLLGCVGEAIWEGLQTTLERASHMLREDSFPRQRDRCCQTQVNGACVAEGGDTVPPPYHRRSHHHVDSQTTSTEIASRPPRFRGRRPWEGRGSERVDALLQRLLLYEGVQVPPNFGRVTSSGPLDAGCASNGSRSRSPNSPHRSSASPTSSHSGVQDGGSKFHFGTKRVEIAAVDDQTLCVHVGGGYLLFTEYCKQHTAFETALWATRLQRQQLNK